MKVEKICFFSLFLLILILGASSVYAGDMNNTTDHDSEIQDPINLSGTRDYYDDFADRGQWSLDENGTPVWTPPASNHSYENASESFAPENVTDLRANSSDNSSENIGEMSSPADMDGIWREFIKNPKEFIEKYRAVPNATSFDITDINNSCSGPTSKELRDFLNYVSQIRDMPNAIESGNINVFYSKNNIYTVRIINPAGVPLGKGANVTFTVKGKKINAKTNDNGYASFKFNFQAGKYSVKIAAGDISSKGQITVKPIFKTKDIKKTYKKPSKFTVRLIKQKGKSVSKQVIKITYKGKTHKIKSNSKGIAVFKIPKNIKIGKHTIKTTYNGCVVKNKITVKR